MGMIFAGHETTALAMTYALHQIGMHPEIADRFYVEVDDVLGGRPFLADLQELEYTEQVINETLRFYLPIHATATRGPRTGTIQRARTPATPARKSGFAEPQSTVKRQAEPSM